MIGVDVNSLPYQQKITFQMLRYIRLTRNLTQKGFGEVCKIEQSVLARLERNDLQLTPHYEAKVMDGVRALSVSQYELDTIKTLLLLKQEK